MSALFLLEVLLVLLIVAPPIARWHERKTDAEIDALLRRMRMGK